MKQSNEEKPFRKITNKETLQESLGRPIKPTRRPKPKPLRDGVEFLTADRVKGLRKSSDTER
ncbi:hypothetical protein ACQJ0K_14615 [Priestia megaterium]|uniref:hypothetical protein n=1 Tax=Priestia megaterium TaxID=1404 RepID=UPI003CECDA3D